VRWHRAEWSSCGINIDAAAKDVDHMIGAEERFKIVMARQ